MKKSLGALTLATVLVFAMSALAANRVVVIPLGGKKCMSPAENSFTNSSGMTFNLIPAGIFIMGSPAGSLLWPGGEPGRDADEVLHQVTLTKSLYMQTTEVTQKQWQDVISNNPATSNSGKIIP